MYISQESFVDKMCEKLQLSPVLPAFPFPAVVNGEGFCTETLIKTAFTGCRHILKTVKNVMDRTRKRHIFCWQN